MGLYSIGGRESGPAPTDNRASYQLPSVSVYGAKDVFYSPMGLGHRLRIIEHNHVLSLPIREKGGVKLCWLDVNRDATLWDVGADIIASRLLWIYNNLHEVKSVGTAPSSKSESCMEEGTRRFANMVRRDVTFFVYPGGYDRDAVARVSVVAPVEHTPVTATPEKPHKYAGVTAEQAAIIAQGGHALADDVASMLATVRAYGGIAMQVGGLDAEPPVAVIAQEGIYGSGYPGEPTPLVFPGFIMPVFVDGLPLLQS